MLAYFLLLCLPIYYYGMHWVRSIKIIIELKGMQHQGLKTGRKRSNQAYLRIFMQFDVDNSGSVSKNEIIKVMKACQMEIDEEEAQDLINEIDADGGGELEQDEFIQFLKREDQNVQYTNDEYRRMFNYFSKAAECEGIGFLELKQMFEWLGEKISDTEVSRMIISGDKNREGKIDFREFCSILKEL